MKTIIAVITASILAGCVVAPPREDYSIIDPKGVDMERYKTDHAECAALANQTDVADRAAGGAVAGAVIGGIVGALFCGSRCAGQVAGLTGLSGAAHGAGSGVMEQRIALRRCLIGRGYRVIR